MSTITPALIKELRELTGVGMTGCKEALAATNGNIQEAVDWLRKKGMASAVKKEGRSTNEGLILAVREGDVVAVVEGNAETDFVVRNEKFQEFLKEITREAAKSKISSLEALLSHSSHGHSVEERRTSLMQSIGENIQIRRLQLLKLQPHSSVGIYSHSGGKIVAVVVMEGSDHEEALAREIAMHVVAATPEYLNPEQVPDSVKDNEKEIARLQVKDKPANVIEKIVEGKLVAFLNGVCLLRQEFVKDDSKTVQQLVEERAKETGKPLKISSYLRWSVGS